MAIFKDSNGREWVLRLDAPTIADVRKACEFDLAKLGEAELVRLYSDPVLLVDVLWVMCRSQATGLTDRQFGSALVGDAIDAATRALLEAVADFSPARKRLLLRSLADRNDQLMDRLWTAIELKLSSSETNAEIERAMLESLDQNLRNTMTRLTSAIPSPGSAASAPTD